MRLGELLVDAGKITPAQLDETLKGQAIFGGRFGTNLVEMGYLDESDLAHFLSKKTGIPHAPPRQLTNIPPQVIRIVACETVRKYRVTPVELNNRKLTLAMVDPTDFAAIDEISFATGYIVVPVIAPELHMVTAMEKYYGIKREVRYISVEGGGRNRSRQAQTAAPPVLAKITIPTPPPPPVSVDWFVPDEEAEILDLPLLDELDCLADQDEEPPFDPLGAAPPHRKEAGRDYSLDAVITGLAHAEDRDTIADLITGHLAHHFRRVALFLLKGGKATGWVARVDEKPAPQFAQVEIPLAEPSALKLVEESKSFFLGPLPATPSNRRMIDAIGGGTADNNLFIPLTMMGRVVAVLYVDGGASAMDARLPELQKLVGKAALAFEILILRSKILMA